MAARGIKHLQIPSFRNWRVAVLHTLDDDVRLLMRQLERLGIVATLVWPRLDFKTTPVDLVFFDGDNGHDDLFSWPVGYPPVPLIAIMNSEAPGRLDWVMSHSVSAYMAKPIRSIGIFGSLVLARSNFEQMSNLQLEIRQLKERLRSRPIVVAAIMRVMAEKGVSAESAYARIRTEAMSHQLTIEAFCAKLCPAAAQTGGRHLL